MDMSKILCVFLMSCSTKPLTKSEFKDCPESCVCYTAPKNGNLWNHEIKSLVCTEIPPKEELKKLGEINTFALEETDVYNKVKLEDKYFNGLSINNVIFEGKISQIHSFDKSISPFTGINELQVITLLKINLKDFNWEALKDKVNLKAIHIEGCHLESLEKSGFNSIKDINLITLTIIDSNLKQIEGLTFENWKSLKMLTITHNKDLKDLNWINKEANFADLWYLDLKDNYIEIIPQNFFSALPKLKVLKLDNNHLKELDWNMLEPVLPHLREFSLYGNDLCTTLKTKVVFDVYNERVESKVKVYPYFFLSSLTNLMCQNSNGRILCHEVGKSDFNDEYCPAERGAKSPQGARV